MPKVVKIRVPVDGDLLVYGNRVCRLKLGENGNRGHWLVYPRGADVPGGQVHTNLGFTGAFLNRCEYNLEHGLWEYKIAPGDNIADGMDD